MNNHWPQPYGERSLGMGKEIIQQKRAGRRVFTSIVAERVGFEPTVPFSTPDFESGTFDHSATSPSRRIIAVRSPAWHTAGKSNA